MTLLHKILVRWEEDEGDWSETRYSFCKIPPILKTRNINFSSTATYLYIWPYYDTNFYFHLAAAVVSACERIRNWLVLSSANTLVILSEGNAAVSLGLRFCFLAGCHSLSVQSNTTACGKTKATRIIQTETLTTIQKRKISFQERSLFELHHYCVSGVVMAKSQSFRFHYLQNLCSIVSVQRRFMHRLCILVNTMHGNNCTAKH